MFSKLTGFQFRESLWESVFLEHLRRRPLQHHQVAGNGETGVQIRRYLTKNYSALEMLMQCNELHIKSIEDVVKIYVLVLSLRGH